MGMTTTQPPPPPPASPPDMTGVVHVGAGCNTDADCDESDLKCFHSVGVGLGAISLPGGYCSKPCDSKTPCPTGGECVATLYGAYCMQRCATGDGNNNKGCRVGYSCCDSVGACGVDSFCGN
jgi:hypothetical protein